LKENPNVSGGYEVKVKVTVTKNRKQNLLISYPGDKSSSDRPIAFKLHMCVDHR